MEAATDYFALDPQEVASLRLIAIAFGTHEDQTFTVACFDDFALEPK